MARIQIDLTEPLVFDGTEIRYRHGRREAVCPSCSAWVVVEDWYKGPRLVINSMLHVYPCHYFENFVKNYYYPPKE